MEDIWKDFIEDKNSAQNLPLERVVKVTTDYPVDAFPKVLRNPMTAIQEDTQIPIEMIGSTLLAAASLALQLTCSPLINTPRC